MTVNLLPRNTRQSYSYEQAAGHGPFGAHQNSQARSKNDKQMSICASAPPKCMGNATSVKSTEPKSKGIVITDDANENVPIPETFEDSNAESESLSERIQRLDGYEDVGQCSKPNGEDETQKFWCMENINELDVMGQVMQAKMVEKTIDSSVKEFLKTTKWLVLNMTMG